MPARQTYLIVETHSIAKAFNEALGLKRSDELPKLRCYASDTLLLAESRAPAAGGSAAVAAAVTASYLLGSVGHDAKTRLFHVGACTARRSAARKVGRIVLANRVVDGSSRKSYYPDILLAHELLEAGIETLPPGCVEEAANGGGPTVPDPASDGPPEGAQERPDLVDRELAGFLAAALTFLAPHQVYGLAAVTGIRGAPAGNADGMLGGDPGDSGADAVALVSGSMGAILRLIEQASRLLRPAGAPLSAAAARAIHELADKLRLTAAQSAQLRSLAEGAAASGVDVLRIAASARVAVRTKQERNRRFDELKRLFRE